MLKQPLTVVSDLALPKLGDTEEGCTYFEPGAEIQQHKQKDQPPAAAGLEGQLQQVARAGLLDHLRPRDPQQVEASKIDELNAIEQAEDAVDLQAMLDMGVRDRRSRVSAEYPNKAEAEAVVATAAPDVSAPSTVDLWGDRCPTFTYLAGAAGSGKTFATKQWAEQPGAGLQLCATTGIAAINLGGETINSILGYFDTASLQESHLTGALTARLGRLWRSGVKRIILDEVSMLAGDQLTFLSRAMEEVNEKGYVLNSQRKRKQHDDDEEEAGPPSMGLTLVGDFLQLAPVKATYAFESPEWAKFKDQTITLTEIRRQADAGFIEALRAARVGDGQTVLDYFTSGGRRLYETTDDTFEGPTLLAKNESVDRYNWLRMSKLTGRDAIFHSTRWGKQRSEWGNPDKPPHTWGIPMRLALKVGALVMVLANKRSPGMIIDQDLDGKPIFSRGSLIYVNGDLGTLVDIEEEHHIAHVLLQRTGSVVAVDYVQREVKIPCDSARRKELYEKGETDKIDGKWEIIGGISYMPLRVAYGSTVHKSQGLSLDRVQINIRDGFFKTPGMLYVALSRARTAEGLRIVGSSAALIERCASDPRLKAYL